MPGSWSVCSRGSRWTRRSHEHFQSRCLPAPTGEQAGASARTDCSNMWTRRLVRVSAASASLSQTVAIGDQDHRRVAMPVAKEVVNHRKELRMRDRNLDKRKRILRDGEKVAARRKTRFTDPQKQSRMIEGVSVAVGHGGIPNYDDLLREALRIALRTDMNPTHDDWDDIPHSRPDGRLHPQPGGRWPGCMHAPLNATTSCARPRSSA